jgi:hypothetical protein
VIKRKALHQIVLTRVRYPPDPVRWITTPFVVVIKKPTPIPAWLNTLALRNGRRENVNKRKQRIYVKLNGFLIRIRDPD